MFDRLVERVAPGSVLVGASPLKGGVSAHVHALDLRHPDGRVERLVVRRHGALAKGHRPEVAADELRLLRILAAAGVPVPEAVACDPDGLVLRFVEGTTELPPDPIGPMAALLADLHALDVDALGVGFLPRRDAPEDEGVTDLPPRRTPLGRRSLLHGDYWPGNVLWRDGRVVALLDWEDAAVGDPMCDLAAARQELCWKLGPEAMAAFTGAYASRAHVDGWQLAVWQVFMARAVLEHMGAWGLAPEVEAAMRRASAALLAASEATIRGCGR